MNESYETLELRRDKDLLWLVLNRPASLNAMNSLLVNELHTVLDELHADQSVRVVILRGAGRRFVLDLISKKPVWRADTALSRTGCEASGILLSWRLRCTGHRSRLSRQCMVRLLAEDLAWLSRVISGLRVSQRG